MAELSKADARADGVEHALMQAGELIESAVSMRRSTPAERSPMVLVSDEPAVAREIETLLDRAERSLSVIMPGSFERARPIIPLLGKLSAVGHAGIEVRVLCTPQVLAPLGLLAAARHGAPGYEVRVTEVDLRGLVIMDRRLAFGRTGPERDGRYASRFGDPGSVRALDLMFAGAWGSAIPLAEHLRLAERMRTEPVRLILGRLRAGHTDDVGAKQVQVSLRTYRRHVAAIMRDVGANTRFQAGVRAVELGLLSDGK
ncbi:helix-turn-helix transcriptional regulator [Streptomyces sp. P1-3]|uniref:helix-turn-helix transcriptional regulator n=1 Tax=Streptomyces sp. P1-3 TaxID=3421658 RepID=UPI003D36655D